MGNNQSKGFGFNIGGGGGGGANTNVANADLTLDADHTTDMDGNTLTFDDAGTNILQIKGDATDSIVIGSSGDDYTMPNDRPSSGQILKASDGSGTIAWASDTDTDENIANTDLTLDGNHTTDVGANTLTFDSGGDDILKIVGGATDLIKIGASGTDYSMPADRGTTQYMLQTDGSGTASWQPEIERISWQCYNNALPDTNYYFANAMTDNKYRALCNEDYGATSLGADTLTISQLIRGGYYVVDRACSVQTINGWGTCNGAGTCTLEIVKFTLENRSSEPIEPTSAGSCSFTGESNNNISSQVTETIGETTLARGDILVPFIRTSEIEETAVVFFNVTIQLY